MEPILEPAPEPPEPAPPPPPVPTSEDARNARAVERLRVRLSDAVEKSEKMARYLARTPPKARVPDWETHAVSIPAERDAAQAAFDEARRSTRANHGFTTDVLAEVMRARLQHWGKLAWVTTVERLGGPPARTVLARIKEIERNGHGTMGVDCPVVQAMQMQDENADAFKMKPKRRVGGPAPRGLERDTGPVAGSSGDAPRAG